MCRRADAFSRRPAITYFPTSTPAPSGLPPLHFFVKLYCCCLTTFLPQKRQTPHSCSVSELSTIFIDSFCTKIPECDPASLFNMSSSVSKSLKENSYRSACTECSRRKQKVPIIPIQTSLAKSIYIPQLLNQSSNKPSV